MIEIRSEIDRSLAQPLEDFFCELVRSPWLIFHEKVGAPHFLMGYFDSEAEALDAWADLRKAFGMLPERPIVGTLEDRDWKEAYKANLHPWNCGRLHWVPEWRRAEYPVPAGAAVVYFDAGLAFRFRRRARGGVRAGVRRRRGLRVGHSRRFRGEARLRACFRF